MKKYLSKEDIRFYITIIVISLILTGLGFLWDTNDIAFSSLNPNPYVIVSILISGYYGFRQSIISMVYFNLYFLALIALKTDFDAIETIFTVQNIMIPLVNLFASPIVGEIRQRSLNSSSDYENKITTLKENVDHFKREVGLKDSENLEYKKRLVSKTDTMSELFKISKRLNNTTVKDILLGAIELLQDNLSTNKISIYLNKKNDFNTFYKMFNENDGIIHQPHFPDTFRRKKPDFIEAEEVLKSIKPLLLMDSIRLREGESNKAINVSCPIVSNEQVVGFIFISGIPFMKYNKENIKLAYIINDWVNSSISNAFRQLKLSENVIIDNELNIFKYNYFFERAEEEFLKAQKYNLDLNVLTLKLENINKASTTKRPILERVIAEVMIKNSPTGHCIAKNDDNFHLLIPMIAKPKIVKLANKLVKEIEEYELTIEDNEVLKIEHTIKGMEKNLKDVEQLIQG